MVRSSAWVLRRVRPPARVLRRVPASERSAAWELRAFSARPSFSAQLFSSVKSFSSARLSSFSAPPSSDLRAWRLSSSARDFLRLFLGLRLLRLLLASSHDRPPHGSSRPFGRRPAQPHHPVRLDGHSTSRLRFCRELIRGDAHMLRAHRAAARHTPSREARPYAPPESPVAGASCVMQPILPVAITSAPVAAILATLRSRRLAAMSGCMML